MRHRLSITNIGFILALIITSVALSFGFLWAKQGFSFKVFGAAAIAWMGYFLAHYTVTGEFVDSEIKGDPIPREPGILLKGTTGLFILLVGILIGSYGIGTEDLIVTNVGAFTFLSGYVVAHHQFTDELL